MANLKGINLAMLTPFNEDGSVNFSVFEELIEKYLEAGVQGIVFGAGTGQHPYYNGSGVQSSLRDRARRVAGRCNVVCQTSALNVDEVIRRSRHAQGAGANALMILPPVWRVHRMTMACLSSTKTSMPRSTSISWGTTFLSRPAFPCPEPLEATDAAEELQLHQG